MQKENAENADDKKLSVCSLNFSQDEVSEKDKQIPVEPVVSENKQVPDSVSKTSGQKRYKIAGAAIFAVLVAHFVWQFSFIQSENLRNTEISVKVIKPVEQVAEKKSNELKKELKNETKTENSPLIIKKDENSAKVKGDEAAISNEINAEKNVQRASLRQNEIKAAPTVIDKNINKKSPRESKAERLRRAEKLLTGM